MNHDRLRRQDRVRDTRIPWGVPKRKRGAHAPWLYTVGREVAPKGATR